MEVDVKEASLFLGDREVKFDFPVGEYAEYQKTVVVVLDVSGKLKADRNVYGINLEGEIVWQLDEGTSIDGHSYVGLFKDNEGTIRLVNFDGTQLVVNPNSGEIIDQKWYK